MNEFDDRATVPAGLQPFLSTDLSGLPDALQVSLRPVEECYGLLARQERRVTFFGAFKSGKTTIINAVVGAPLLPTRANRATGVATALRYGATPAAGILRADGSLADIPFDDAARHILLQLVDGEARVPINAEAVSIDIPLDFLRDRCTLVDTPGLLDNETLTERTYRELERTDLAVMVLSADKILSAAERQAAGAVHDLLLGNIVFVVNRLNLVDEEDREEVLEWTRTALRGLDNELVGQPSIFALAARPGRGESVAKLAGGPAGQADGSIDFQHWLLLALDPPFGEQLARRARLGILRSRLRAAQAELEQGRDRHHRTVQTLQAHESAALESERKETQLRIASDRRRLAALRAGLSDDYERFVQTCLESIGSGSDLATEIRRSCQRAVEEFIAHLDEQTRILVAESGIPMPAFQPNLLLIDPVIPGSTHLTSRIGASLDDLLGRADDAQRAPGPIGDLVRKAPGASAGQWLGKNIFGVDQERETHGQIERAVRAVVPALTAETEIHFERVDGLLTEANRFYSEWSRTSYELVEGIALDEQYTRWIDWCSGFLDAIEKSVPVIS